MASSAYGHFNLDQKPLHCMLMDNKYHVINNYNMLRHSVFVITFKLLIRQINLFFRLNDTGF